MLLSLLPMNMVFAEIVESGSCGDNVTWTLDSAGTLTISGSGAMDDTSSSSYSKWSWKCKSLVIEGGVTYVGAYSFYECRYLTDVTIKSGVHKIGSYAFSNCKKLTKVNLDDNIEFIGSSAFSNCSALVSINIPNQLKKLSSWAFGGCESLKEINISDGLSELGYAAFSGCKNLEKIVLPESITIIGLLTIICFQVVLHYKTLSYLKMLRKLIIVHSRAVLP